MEETASLLFTAAGRDMMIREGRPPCECFPGFAERNAVLTSWLEQTIDALAKLAPPGTVYENTFAIRALLSVILVGLICGGVGSLVVGNRMAFFSDALAHCSFAGIALGFLTALFVGIVSEKDFVNSAFLVMIIFGILIGLAIALVREKTTLTSDTVIGVFFAGAIGFGAMMLKGIGRRRYFNPESFLFGADPINIGEGDLLWLLLLALLTALFLMVLFNQLLFTSFNPSLARSRNIRLRLCNYLFIVLLALIVNLCLITVGALLINALLIVPAATANNLSRNMRQMFWLSIGLSLFVSIVGQLLSSVSISFRDGETLSFGSAGIIVVLSVLLFFASMLVGPYVRGRQVA